MKKEFTSVEPGIHFCFYIIIIAAFATEVLLEVERQMVITYCKIRSVLWVTYNFAAKTVQQITGLTSSVRSCIVMKKDSFL